MYVQYHAIMVVYSCNQEQRQPTQQTERGSKMAREIREIRATFRDGRQATYTTAIIPLMMTDPDVIEIMDLETGEIYKC